MFLAKVSINRPVMITMLVSVFVVFGILAYFTLPLNLMPQADLPYITIQTIYPGAGPAEIETQITKRIEDAVSTISRIDFIESYSMDNVSLVVLAFELGKQIDVASQEVRQKVDAILNEFPADAEKPSIDKFDPGSWPIMELILTGDMDSRGLFEIADKTLKDRFSQIEGVAKVNITGGQEREIQVKLSDRAVSQNLISLPQLAQILSAHNLNMPGGHFLQADQEYTVRLEGEMASVEELENLDIPTSYGTRKLRQLALISDSGKEIRKRAIYYDNFNQTKEDNVVRISIVKTAEGNPVSIAQAVYRELDAIRAELPAQARLVIVDDDSRFIRSSLGDTLSNVFLGILFTGLVLLFFLHDLRSTLIVAVAMPTSIISTFLAIQLSGFSINILTLMGLSTSVGILVTNSVVVLENIFRHMQMGNTRRQASNIGTTEISVAVIASTLTNIVVFLPLATMGTMVGQFLREFALTVTFATIFSLLISFTITPMMSSLILPEKQKKNKIGIKMEKMFHNWERAYAGTLEKIIHNRFRSVLVLVAALVIFLATLVMIAPQLGFEFMPKVDEGNINIAFELPQGYNLEETAALYETIESRIRRYDEVKHLIVSLGSQGWIDEGTNIASLDVKLVDAENRERSSDEMADLFIRDLADIPNARIKVMVQSSMGAGGGSAIEFYLLGQDSGVLSQITADLLEQARSVPGLINFDSSNRVGKPELTLIPRRDQMAAAQVTIYELALILRSSIEGLVATQYREGGNEYDIVVSLMEEAVDTPEKIRNIPVITANGSYRISQLAEVVFSEGSTKILRREKYKAVSFTGDVARGYVQGEVMAGLQKLLDTTVLPEGYRFKWAGSSEMMQENNREMARAFLIAILLTYMLLAAILESFTKPILILLTLPLALIGVFLALYITGQSFNMVSMMGVIMLLGIVVNAAILLLDYTQQLRSRGRDTREALLEACPTKLKPIIMSSLAIIMGMLPMALGVGTSGAEMRQPLGIVSIGGLIVSTILTLYVIPAFYYLTTRKHIEQLEKV